MKKFKKASLAAITLSVGLSSATFAAPYTVKAGDSFWKISRQFDISLEELLKANNANERTIIHPGQVLEVPKKGVEKDHSNKESTGQQNNTHIAYTIQKGDSFWKISRQFGISLEDLLKVNNANERTVIYPGQTLKIPKKGVEKVKDVDDVKVEDVKDVEKDNNSKENTDSKNNDCIVHTIEKGDTLWKLSRKYNVSMKSIIDSNKRLNENSILYIGQTINIPSSGNTVVEDSNENVKDTKYGEYLHWFNEVNDLISIGSVFKVTDFHTGKSFMVKRTMGSYHADVETLTVDDTNMLKEIWGGFSWVRRPAIAEYNGRRIACSVTAMPHAGNDQAKGGVYTNWRSGGYGSGTNLDYIKGNGMDGHIDIHFYGSKRHKDGRVDPDHQKCIKKAAGLLK